MNSTKRAIQVSELEINMSVSDAVRHLTTLSDDLERTIMRLESVEGMRASEKAMTMSEYRLEQAALLKAVIALQKKKGKK